MNIAFVAQKYNWDSYSVVRIFFEHLETKHKVYFFEDKYWPGTDFKADIIFAVGANAEVDYPNDIPVVRFGMSDPNLYNADRYDGCDMYVTNSFDISRKTGAHYMPCFSDIKYFNVINGSKYCDLVFVGVGKHPYIPDRIEKLERIRKEGFDVKVFGNAWPQHNDNYEFVTGEHLVRVINRSRIMLDLTNKDTAISSRIFQAAMCGVPTITMYREDIANMFEDSKEIILYDSYQHMIDLIDGYLKSPEELDEVAKGAHRRCCADHQIGHRVDVLWRALGTKGLL